METTNNISIRKEWRDQSILQGPILRKISDISDPSNPRRRDEFIEDLENTSDKPDYVSILRSWQIVDAKEEAHLRRDWFPEQGQSPWFPLENGKALENRLRRDTLEAFKIAQRENRPLEYYWAIPVKSTLIQFEIFTEIEISKHQITFIRFTPRYIKDSS